MQSGLTQILQTVRIRANGDSYVTGGNVMALERRRLAYGKRLFLYRLNRIATGTTGNVLIDCLLFSPQLHAEVDAHRRSS